MLKLKTKADKEVHAFEFHNQAREKELTVMWNKNKDGEQSIKLGSKHGQSMEIKFKDIEFLIFDNSKLVSQNDIDSIMPDCPLM